VLKHLVGPECIQVRDPESVAFKPTQLMQDLCAIYTNLSEIPHFCKAVVKDERSFKPEYLGHALRRLKMARIVGLNLRDLEVFIQKMPQYTQEEARIEEMLGNDAPEEFLCPFSCELMRDPVLLPTSGTICDSSSMKRVLLNDEHDPFNRAPLRMMDLVP
jgi:ubiquitin conjugation factor E4 B